MTWKDESSWTISQRPLRDQDADFEREFSLLKRNVKQAWWLKVFLIVLCLPLIALVALSWPQRSERRPTRTPHPGRASAMIQSELITFSAFRQPRQSTDQLPSTRPTIERDKARD